jgi:hypothetical protein
VTVVVYGTTAQIIHNEDSSLELLSTPLETSKDIKPASTLAAVFKETPYRKSFNQKEAFVLNVLYERRRMTAGIYPA